MICSTLWRRDTSLLIVRLAFLLFMAAIGLSAGEFAVLTSGFKVHAQKHEIVGDTVQLETDSGKIELPVSSIVSFEAEEYTPPAPAPAPKPAANVTQPAPVSELPKDPKALVAEIARRAGLPPELVHSLVLAESGYRQNAVSPKGAIGLMQLMPGTAAALNANPYDLKQNIEAGVAYLRELLVKYQDDPHQVTKALAAYNAGPGAVDRYNGIPPYRETIDYVSRIVRQYMKSQGQ